MVIISLLVVCLAISIKTVPHIIHEGYVGVYYRAGALLPVFTVPGIHFKIPILTSVHEVQTTVQTDMVRDIPCGTRGGVMVYFEKIEVVNQLSESFVINTTRRFGLEYDKNLIFDKVHHEINQLCSRSTLQEVFIDHFDRLDDNLKDTLQADCDKFNAGLHIIAVRVTKPVIPKSIMENYEAMESQKTKLLIAAEAAKVAAQEAETDKMRATVEAEKVAAVSKIRVEMQIREKEGSKQLADIENAMFLSKQKALADSETYRIETLARANEKLLTKEYLHLQSMQAMAQNTKVYFGEKIPTSLYLRSSEAEAT